VSRRSKRKAAAAARPDGASKRKRKAQAAPEEEGEQSELRMTLTEHLAELRSRIIKSVLAIALGALLIMVFWDRGVFAFLRHPYDTFCQGVHGQAFCSDGKGNFLADDPLGPFGTRVSVAGWGGLIFALPVVLWQLWRFVVPGLHSKEKKYAGPFIVSSVVLFAFGAAIAYWLLAKSLQFLLSWGGSGYTVALSVNKYLRLLTLMMIAFGTGFLFPVLLVFLQLVNVLTPRTLLKYWRHATVAVIVVAAVITPSGDLFSLFGLAIPMWIFFWASIAIGAVLRRNRTKEPTAAGVG
jgi:sec-independent protein translocase protein TatC